MITVYLASIAHLAVLLFKSRLDLSRASYHGRVLPFVRLMLTTLRNQKTRKPEAQRSPSKTQARPKPQRPLTRVPTLK